MLVHMILSFREMTKADLEFFIEVRNEVRTFLHNPSFFTLEEAEKWFPSSETQYWIISSGSEDIGYFRVKKKDLFEWQIGADIHPSFQGMGLGTLSYDLFIQYIATKNFTLPRLLSLRVLKKNDRAIALYKKLKFEVVEETELDYCMKRNFQLKSEI